jgi:type I restriction enzyme S subunit
MTKRGWARCRLIDACLLITDGTHHSPPNGPTGAFKYVTAKNIKSNGLDLSEITFVDAVTHREIFKRAPASKGDVLYIKDGATTGVAAVNTLDEQFSLLSSVALLKTRPELLGDVYLARWLNSPVARGEMLGQMSGSAIRRLTLGKIGEAEIELPPRAEQRRIVAKIDALSARSKGARADLYRVEALAARAKQAVLAAAFRGELSGGAVSSWLPRPLSEMLSDLRYGTAKKCGPVGAVPVLRIPNIQSGLVDTSDLKFADFDPKEIGRLSLQTGELLMVRSNGSVSLVGQSAVVPQAAAGMLFAGYLIRLQVDRSRVDPNFLHLMLASPKLRRAIEQEAKSTSGVNNINSRQIEALQVPFPRLEEQVITAKKTTILLGAIDVVVKDAIAAGTLLDRLDQGILAKAFRGELVPQDPADEPASVLLDRIRAERAQAAVPKRRAAVARRAG